MKFIIVTGGVYSGIGKGVVSASIASMLCANYRVINIKWDGYHNYDPGTLSPIEHGECFVTDDGYEVDLDFGHYERFTGRATSGACSITRGKLNKYIAQLERTGRRYEGKTIQEIPHLRDLLVEMIVAAADGNDITVFEIGGTVGDDESNLALHAALALVRRFGRPNVMFVHVAPLCYTIDGHEPKTKPIQRSLADLQSRGIMADMVVVRTEETGLDPGLREKISAAIDPRAIIAAPHLATVYALPIEFVAQGVPAIIANTIAIDATCNQSAWCARLGKMTPPNDRAADSAVTILLCGKYTAVADSYVSITEALTHAGAQLGVRVNIAMRSAGATVDGSGDGACHGILVPGGYGTRGVTAKLDHIRWARENKVPFLGLCYGMQLAVVEFARNVCGLEGAHTTEVDPETPHPVIDLLPGQSADIERSGTQRLGAEAISLLGGTIMSRAYDGAATITERHRHRYEVNPKYHLQLASGSGDTLVFSAMNKKHPDLVEAIELPASRHPFFVAVQSHPEFKSAFMRPAPLFVAFVEAALAQKKTAA